MLLTRLAIWLAKSQGAAASDHSMLLPPPLPLVKLLKLLTSRKSQDTRKFEIVFEFFVAEKV